MWLEQRVALLGGLTEPSLIVAPLSFGGAQLIHDAHGSERPLVWLELKEGDAEDPVLLGNRLAEAVNRPLAARLLSHGLPYAYNLALLQGNLPYLGPMTLALSRAEVAPEFASAILALHGSACRVLLQFEELPEGFAPPEGARLSSEGELRLSHAEALELAAGRISREEALGLHRETNGAIELFSSELHRLLDLPPHLLPGPEGPRPLPGYANAPDAEALLKLLRRKGRWLDALELAVHQLPHRAPEVLLEAGHAYHEQGLHRRLWGLLERLPPELQAEEGVRYWRLECAFRLGNRDALRQETLRYLKIHEAPALRAMAAGVFVPTSREEALCAFEAEATPFTAFQLGRLSDGPEAVEVLRQSVRLAEREGRPYEVVRNAGALAAKLIFLGDFAGALHWGGWALREYERLGVRDGQRKLLIVNNWAYVRLLTGDLAGLELLLKEHEANLSIAEPELAGVFRSTLGDFLLASARPSEALVYYRRNLEEASRWQVGDGTLSMVQALLDLGETEEALRLSGESLAVLGDVGDYYRLPAVLAHGMALTFADPERALPYLLEAQHGFRTTVYSAHRLAQGVLYLALAYQRLGKPEETDELLFAAENHLLSLAPSGLRLLSGPETTFRAIWARVLGLETPLELRFLGQPEAWLEGERLELYPQWLEILAALAIRERPVTLEGLLADLYGDGGSETTLKAALSRMRHFVPISFHPYRIETPYHADFLEVLELLKRGELRAAIALYRGPLFPYSESPLLRATDRLIAEALRGAALIRRDPETLLRLFEHFPDDLELLEAAEGLLEPGDPRLSLVRARAELVRSDWQN